MADKAVNCVPCLGPKGYVYDGKTQLDLVMGWLYASDYSQSYFFDSEISSFAKIIQKNQGRLEAARQELQTLLTSYLGRYFTDVEVLVSIYENKFVNSHLNGELMLKAVMKDRLGEELQLSEIMTKTGGLARTLVDQSFND